MDKSKVKPVLRNIVNDMLYEHIENDIYENIATGVRGEIPPDVAQKKLRINMDISILCAEYPEMKNIINRLKLRVG